MSPEEMVGRLLYRDGLMLVIDKPAGFAVHRGPKGGESLEDYFDALRFGLPRAPSLAHRLDRDTSGCLVLGRHRKALAELGRLFKVGRVGKTYWAVVEGGPTAEEGRIDLPLGRLDERRGWWMRPDPGGQPAVTEWRVLGRLSSRPSAAGARAGTHRRGQRDLDAPADMGPRFRGDDNLSSLTWLALTPLTGRTHQLRVHCAEMGWPIVGDAIYGTQASLRRLRNEGPHTGGPILHLHSREVVVPLYKNREPIRVTAPVPKHMRERLTLCGWSGETKPTVLSKASP
jgi:tRNA pseudouridine32 synthase/23S rRNA pseudouridine746 synthase